MRGTSLAAASFLAICLAMLLTTCGDGEPSRQVAAGDGDIVLRVPEGALPENATVTITEASAEAPVPGELEGAQPVGRPFKIEVGGQRLSKPVTLEIAYYPGLLTEDTFEDAVFLAYFDEGKGEWVPVGGQVDAERNVVILETDHLSWWNPFTWNWEAWIAILKKTLSLKLTEWVEGFQLLTEECEKSGENVTVDESRANNVIQGCITADDPSNPELRVVNLKSFFLGISPAPDGPGYPEATLLGPGDAVHFTASTSDTPPATVYADFTKQAMWRFVAGLVARMLPGGELIPDEGLAFIAEGLQRVVSATELSEALDAGDTADAAEATYQLITGDTFIETFVKLAHQYGEENGIDMMTKWTEAGVAEVLKAVAAVDVIISAWDFLWNYALNYHSAVAFSWSSDEAVQAPQATPPATGTPVAKIDLRLLAVDFEENPAKLSPYRSPREGWRKVGVYVDIEYWGGLPDDTLSFWWTRPYPHVSVAVPNLGTYPLHESFVSATHSEFIPLVPGARARLYFEGEVPEVLPTIEGSTVVFQMLEGRSGQTEWLKASLPLEKGATFSHGSPAGEVHQFRSAIPIHGGQLEVTSIEGVPSSAGWSQRARVKYIVTNETGYDLRFRFEGGTLIDANGYPYVFNVSECVPPPGYSQDCEIDTLPGWGAWPYSEYGADPPDVSDVLLIFIPGPYVFRGSGQ